MKKNYVYCVYFDGFAGKRYITFHTTRKSALADARLLDEMYDDAGAHKIAKHLLYGEYK